MSNSNVRLLFDVCIKFFPYVVALVQEVIQLGWIVNEVYVWHYIQKVFHVIAWIKAIRFGCFYQ